MKKYNKFGYAGAMLLAGLVSFSACSSDDELAEVVNPNVEGEAVKTQFALNIPRAGKSSRMTADNTQNTKNPATVAQFLGMQNIRMYPFKVAVLDKGAEKDNEPIEAGSLAPIDGLTPISLANIAATTGLVDISQAKKYESVLVPFGTTSLLFYGQAGTSLVSNPNDYFTYGKINTSIKSSPVEDNLLATTKITQPSDISFQLQPITTKTLATVGSEEVGKAMLALLNGVKNAELTSDPDGVELSWKTCGTYANPDYKVLGDLYNTYIKNTAGSSNSVLYLMDHLYNTLDVYVAAINEESNTCQKLAKKIQAAIVANYTHVQLATGSSTGNPSKPYNLDYSTDPKFPSSLNLPDGAIQVASDAGKDFEFVTQPTNSMLQAIGVADLNKYVYPASLYYMANSAIVTSANEMLSILSQSWDDVIAQSGYTTAAVDATTKSVSMINPINYAVSVLEAKINNATGTFNDSYNNVLEASYVQSLTLTGVLIGGQNNVDWNFTATGPADLTVYDKNVVAEVKPNGTNSNYTLVMPTVIKSGADADPISVALEFTNGNTPFYGKDKGLIPAGGKFYLVAQLKPTSQNGRGVFEKDCKTVATFALNKNSFKNAYNVIPDLRTAKLEFGLSVDLKWEEGLKFENVPLGQ